MPIKKSDRIDWQRPTATEGTAPGYVGYVAEHKTETGGSQYVHVDLDGQLWLTICEPVAIEQLKAAHPHLVPQAERAIARWRGSPPGRLQ